MKDLTLYKMWLTRRYVKLLYPILQQLIASDEKSRVQKREEAQRVEEAFEREQAMREAGMQAEAPKRFATTIQKEPLGPKPILLSRIEIKPVEDNLGILCLYPQEGSGFEIGIDSLIAQSLCKLLAEVETKAEWALGLNP